jgi:hypothetical protein
MGRLGLLLPRGGAVDNPQWFPTYKSGSYYFCNSTSNATTSNTLGNGTLRITPWVNQAGINKPTRS